MNTKRIFHAVALLLVLAGCAKENAADVEVSEDKVINVFMPDVYTKTAFGTETDGKFPLLWSKGDEIAVIENRGADDQKVSVYTLVGDGGTAAGSFKFKSGDADDSFVTDMVYPASAASDPAVPAVQSYVAGSFDPKALVMSWSNPAGMTEAGAQMESLASVICLQLTSANAADVKQVKAVLTASDGTAKTYTLSCPSVVLSETPTPFFIAVDGSDSPCDVTFEITHTAGVTDVKETKGKVFAAGNVLRFPAVDIVGEELSAELPAIGTLYEGGVVFEANNTYVKVVSLKEASGLAWSTENVVTGCSESQDDGYEYTQKLLSLSTYTAETYPAVTWCVSLGEGWYLPSPRELISIRKNLLDLATEDEAKKTAANELMTSLGGDPFSWGMYWSSRENGESKAYVARLNKTVDSNYKKNNTTNYCTRAVKKIAMTGGETPDAVVVRETEETTYQVAMDTYFNNDTNGFAEDKCKGAEYILRTRYISGNGTYTFYPFYKFDISNVTSDKLISATLKLSVESLAFNGDDKTNGSVSLYFYKSSTEWDESSLILPSIDKSVSSDCIVKSDDQIINVDVTTIVSAALDASETYVSITQGLSSQANTGTNIYVHSREATDEAVRPVLVLKTYK